MNRPDPRQRFQKMTPPGAPGCGCGCSRHAGSAHMEDSMYRRIDGMMPGMAYVPVQEFHTLFDPCKALKAGTVFPELCKPFCGKRGGKR